MLWLRFRAQWRSLRLTLVALTLLVGVVGATVLTTLAGARRTGSVVERVDDALGVPDAFALMKSTSFDAADDVLDSPVVADGDRLAAFAVFPEHGYLPLVGSVDGKLGTSINYERLLRGRRPAPGRPHEVAVPDIVAREYNLEIGSRMPFRSLDVAHGDCLYTDERSAARDPKCRETLRGLNADPPDLSVLRGPRFELEVVGITRALEDAGSERSGDLVVFLPAAFYAEHRDDIASLPGVIVRYRPGVTDEQFEAALAKVVGIESLPDFTHSSSTIDALDATAGTLATGLLVFAAVAALAGLVAISQALARHAALAAPDRRVLGALGAPRAQRVADVVMPLLPVAVGGALLAVAGAWIASPIMPIGSVRELEVNGGFAFDPVVLGAGAVLLALLVLAIGAAAAVWSSRSGVGSARRRTRVSGVPVSVPAGLGVRWALQPGHGTTAVPIRSAISGVALGVAGIVAVAGFAEGLERLTHEPRRSGWGWDVGIAGESAAEAAAEADATETENAGSLDPALLAERARRIATDPAVEGVTAGWLGLRAPVNGRSVPAYAQHVYEPGAGFVVIDGRAPIGPTEVALGAKTMDRAGVGIGDDVTVGDATMSVVGQALFPEVGEGYPLADGVLLSDLGLATAGEHVSHENEYLKYGVRLAPNADRDAAIERLTKLNQDEVPDPPKLSSDIARLGQLDNLPAYLALFLFVVASLAVAHALIISLHRRRRELAIVRALGATSRQATRTVAWQATVIALLGVLIGLPAGLLLGRYIWASVAHAYGVADDVAWPAFAVIVAIPVTVLVANAIALFPGRRAARIVPAEALRSE
jgi:hypothetical protein